MRILFGKDQLPMVHACISETTQGGVVIVVVSWFFWGASLVGTVHTARKEIVPLSHVVLIWCHYDARDGVFPEGGERGAEIVAERNQIVSN
jgi:hypothetical protein